MRASSNKEPNYGARMFCDRFEKNPPKQVSVEVIMTDVMDRMIEVMKLANELKQKSYNKKFEDGGIPIYPNIIKP